MSGVFGRIIFGWYSGIRRVVAASLRLVGSVLDAGDTGFDYLDTDVVPIHVGSDPYDPFL